ncbi:MAG: hypothetical protein D3921_02235 [Candidatus Electrothrix sp. AW1]|nr:hypothetical protein [Candidatus Electrothrix sp. AX1]MCI5181344.1 hypothetical protein [Candidatus Electrothrix gigas]
MNDLMWMIFILLMVVLVISVFWLIWRLRHFSQSNNQTILDDKLMQSMLGDEALSKELKTALVGKASGVKVLEATASPSSQAEQQRSQQAQKPLKKE